MILDSKKLLETIDFKGQSFVVDMIFASSAVVNFSLCVITSENSDVVIGATNTRNALKGFPGWPNLGK